MDRVLGREGGCSGCGGGEAISREGLEQFPTAALDNEPLWDSVDLEGGLSGVDGEEEEGERSPGVSRLAIKSSDITACSAKHVRF